jgi:S1-C subfamily serine protease
MTHHRSEGDVQLNRSLIVGGGVLVAVGGLLGFAGMAMVTSALISATRRWVDHMEQPPSDIAKRKWQQTKAAATAGAAAGAAAWRDRTPTA